jgi:hypothetical protein
MTLSGFTMVVAEPVTDSVWLALLIPALVVVIAVVFLFRSGLGFDISCRAAYTMLSAGRETIMPGTTKMANTIVKLMAVKKLLFTVVMLYDLVVLHSNISFFFNFRVHFLLLSLLYSFNLAFEL